VNVCANRGPRPAGSPAHASARATGSSGGRRWPELMKHFSEQLVDGDGAAIADGRSACGRFDQRGHFGRCGADHRLRCSSSCHDLWQLDELGIAACVIVEARWYVVSCSMRPHIDRGMPCSRLIGEPVPRTSGLARLRISVDNLWVVDLSGRGSAHHTDAFG
jgi:hypothetical protein